MTAKQAEQAEQAEQERIQNAKSHNWERRVILTKGRSVGITTIPPIGPRTLWQCVKCGVQHAYFGKANAGKPKHFFISCKHVLMKRALE